ncbi:hypothetical protein BH24CHL4_BH24CHL4_17920 [soil metagenome]
MSYSRSSVWRDSKGTTMASYTSSVSPKGQVTIPAEIRDKFGIHPKDTVNFRVVDDTITIVPVRSKLLAGYRSIPALVPPLSWEEVRRIAREEHALHAASEVLEPADSDLA